MNLFEKIRELKFPFIALVAAMSFSGLVAPANAAIPTLTSVTVSNITPASATVSFVQDITTASGVPIGCAMLARPSTSPAPTAAYIFSGSNTANGDLSAWTNNAGNPNGVNSGSLSLNQLSAGTSYTAYIACKDGGSFSSVRAETFTTVAAPPAATALTMPTVTFSGTTFTATQEAVWSGSTNSPLWLACTSSQAASTSAVSSPPAGCKTISSAAANFSVVSANTLNTATTYYTNTAGNYTAISLSNFHIARLGVTNSSPFVVVWSATVSSTGGSGSSQQQQQSTTSVRPAPAFNITNRPAVSANGQTLTLNGENLSDVTTVKVAGKEAKISKKASGEIVIDVPAGTEGFPDVELLHAGGAITMQGLIQVIKPYSLTRSLNITKFVGNRPTFAGLAALERTYLKGTTANVLTCVATVASDASAEEIAKAETRANATCARVVNYSKYIKTADVQIKKDGAAGSKPVLAVTFDRTLDGK